VADVEDLAFSLARELLRFDQPIPDFDRRSPGILESCLAVPFQAFGHWSPYPTLATKAAMLFYLLIKNHPFYNGNKRIAITALLVFLSLNDKWVRASIDEAYRLAVWVAGSDPADKDLVVAGVRGFIEDHLIGAGEALGRSTGPR
jgi:death-on-curing protein